MIPLSVKQVGTPDSQWRHAKAPFEVWFLKNYQVSDNHRCFETDCNGIFIFSAVKGAYGKWRSLRGARALQCAFFKHRRKQRQIKQYE